MRDEYDNVHFEALLNLTRIKEDKFWTILVFLGKAKVLCGSKIYLKTLNIHKN